MHITCVYAKSAGKLYLGSLFKQAVVAGRSVVEAPLLLSAQGVGRKVAQGDRAGGFVFLEGRKLVGSRAKLRAILSDKGKKRGEGRAEALSAQCFQSIQGHW